MSNDLRLVDERGQPLTKALVNPGTPFFAQGELGGWFQLDSLEDGWQRNLSVFGKDTCGADFACKNIYAQALATMQARHVRYLEDGGTEIIKTSPLSRILRNPNPYQTWTDFIYNFVFATLTHGNGYAYADRDDSNRITALHRLPSDSAVPYVDTETQDVYYGVGPQPMINIPQVMIPAREVQHLRIYTPEHPLIGVSAIRFAKMPVLINNAIAFNQSAFFSNMSRPSGVLTTDEKLTKEQMDALRNAWYERSRGVKAGEVPVLGWGLKWNPMTITSEDAQLIEAYRMSVEDIARVYRVPLALLGDYTKATYNNTEQMIGSWLATGLGFMMEHIERSFTRFFNLPPEESMQFDTEALLRTDFAGRIDALTKAISGGLMSPNEARSRERLPRVEYGDEPRVQQQNVPLSAVGQMPEAPSAPEAPPPAPAEEPPTAEDEDTQRSLALIQLKRMLAA